jgi:hypothetical protein
MEDEKMINGILHYYEKDNKVYVPYTIQALSTAFVAMRSMYENEKILYEQANENLQNAKNILKNA